MTSIIGATIQLSIALAVRGPLEAAAVSRSLPAQERPASVVESPYTATLAVCSSAPAPDERQLAREMTCKITRILAVAPKVTPKMRAFAASDDFKKLKDSPGRRSLEKAFESAREAVEHDAPAATVMSGQDSAIEACNHYKLDECRNVTTKLEAIQNLSGCGGELWGDLSKAEKAWRARQRGAPL